MVRSQPLSTFREAISLDLLKKPDPKSPSNQCGTMGPPAQCFPGLPQLLVKSNLIRVWVTALNGARTSEFHIQSLIKYLHNIYYVPGTEGERDSQVTSFNTLGPSKRNASHFSIKMSSHFTGTHLSFLREREQAQGLPVWNSPKDTESIVFQSYFLNHGFSFIANNTGFQLVIKASLETLDSFLRDLEFTV